MDWNSQGSMRAWSRRARVSSVAMAITGALAGGGALIAAAREPARAPAAPAAAQGPFQPSWESLQQYRCPEWFRDAKFGIEARWDAQSVPEQGDDYAKLIYDDDEADHKYHVQQYGHPSRVGFKEILPLWHAERWDPAKLIRLYRQAGARYFVALANDEDNFDCFASTYQRWNSVNMGPHRDIVGSWAREARKAGLRFGVAANAAQAWSWFQLAQGADDDGPLTGLPYDGRLTRADGKGKWWDGYDPQELYAQNHRRGARPDAAYVERFFRRTRELIEKYHPALLSFDDPVMPLNGVSDVGLRLAAAYYNDDMRRHGGRLEAVLNTQSLNEAQRRCLVWDIQRGTPAGIEPCPWQTDTSIGQWAYQRRLFEQHRYKTPEAVIQMLADVVSKNGNMLLNIPLRGDGTIDADEERFLTELARWMKVNGEAIFGTRPWKVYGEGPAAEAPAPGFTRFNERIARPLTAQDLRFTTRGSTLYAIAGGWSASGTLTIRSLAARSSLEVGKVTGVRLLGHPGNLQWVQDENGLTIQLPAQKPCDYAVAFKIEGGA